MDKRRAHLSSQILSGEITRDEALIELKKPLYDAQELMDDKAYIAKKLGLELIELEKFENGPRKHYSDYPNWDTRYKLMKKVRDIIQTLLQRDLKKYSDKSHICKFLKEAYFGSPPNCSYNHNASPE